MHETVLLDDAINLLCIKPDGIYVDGTFGRGGHSLLILKKLNKLGKLIIVDKDLEAIEFAKQTIKDNRVLIIHDSFANLKQWLIKLNIQQINGLLLDLGVSSPQLDNPKRGFSFRFDEVLDMRMDITNGISAKEWINFAPENEISRVLWEFGEERCARVIAKNIVNIRNKKPINTTKELANIIENSVSRTKNTIHKATKSFQAIRIFINNELEDLKTILNDLDDILAINGRAVIISFHSLEDRIVKQKFNELSSKKIIAKWLPENNIKINFKKILQKLKPDALELKRNIRSRSAILRAIEKVN